MVSIYYSGRLGVKSKRPYIYFYNEFECTCEYGLGHPRHDLKEYHVYLPYEKKTAVIGMYANFYIEGLS